MKSSFLLTIALSALISTTVSAQGNRTRAMRGTTGPRQIKPVAKPSTPVTSSSTSTQTVAAVNPANKTAFERFYDRLSISYFGQATSPNLKKWSSKNAALSPQLGDERLNAQDTRRCPKNCDSYAANLWSQVNFAYDFGWKMKFNFIPRWTTYLGHPRDMQRAIGEDRAIIGLEDFLFGFSGVIYTSENKKFNWWTRPGVRLPTSHFSRHYNNGAFGDLTSNVEIAHSVTYDFNAQWQIGFNAQQRMWVFEDRYNPSRFRFYTAPYISYAFTDHTKVQWYYQNMIENNKRWHTIGDRKKVAFRDIYQDTFVGVAHDFTDRLNIMPYVGMFVDDIPLSMESAYVGAWISYRIK